MNLDQIVLECMEEHGDYSVGSITSLNHQKFASRIVQECMHVVRREWYEENNKDTELYDSRQIAMHVGMKSAYTNIINELSKLK